MAGKEKKDEEPIVLTFVNITGVTRKVEDAGKEKSSTEDDDMCGSGGKDDEPKDEKV